MPARRHKREPTIALINIVFLMLVFFMVAGTLSTPIDGPLALVQTAELDGNLPLDVLVLHANGDMRSGGEPVDSLSRFYASLADTTQLRLLPDRALPAADLIRVAADLKALGAGQVLIITERSLP